MKLPELSKGEMEVARVLWELKRATVRQVHDTMPAEREMDFTTVQTYLRRLEAKGYAKTKLEQRVRVYTPSVQPERVIRRTIDDFVDRLFGGDAIPMVKHLIESHDISKEDLAKLRQLLDERQPDAKKGGRND